MKNTFLSAQELWTIPLFFVAVATICRAETCQWLKITAISQTVMSEIEQIYLLEKQKKDIVGMM